jgi:hypothetical protein
MAEEHKEQQVANWSEFDADFAMFVEAGFVAANQLDENSAKMIFAAAQALRPESTAPKLGLGFIALNKLEVKEAKKLFVEVTTEEPDNLLAQTMLGICHLLVPESRAKGEELIKAILEKTDDPTTVNLAKVALEWSDKDLKKKVVQVS